MRGLVLIVGVCAASPACGSPPSAPPATKSAATAGEDAATPIDADGGAPDAGSALSGLPKLDFATPYRETPGDPAAARALIDKAHATADRGEAIRWMIQALAADPSDTRTRYELASRYAAAGDPKALALLAELTFAGCDRCLAFRDDARWRDDWQPLWDSDALFEILGYRRPQDPATAEASLYTEAQRGTGSPISCPAGTRPAGTWRANRIDDAGEVWCVKPGGVRHGPYYKYDEHHGAGDSTQEITGQYRSGKKLGLWRTVLGPGDSTEGAYVDDRQHGVWTALGRDQITFTVYLDGKPHGRRLQVVDDELHHVLSDERYDHGVLDGPVRHFQEQPWTLWEAGRYVQGKKHGEWVYFDEDGHRRIREHWDTGVPNGAFEYWDASGGVVDQVQLAHGSGRWVSYDTASRKLAEGALAANKKIGMWGELAEDDAGWDTGAYRDGVATGTWQQLASNGGNKLAEGNYRAGQRSGAWTFWHPDGTLRAKGGFRAGKPDGAWTLFDDRGEAPVQQLGFRAGALITIDGVRATRAWQRGARRVRFERAPGPVAAEDDSHAQPL